MSNCRATENGNGDHQLAVTSTLNKPQHIKTSHILPSLQDYKKYLALTLIGLSIWGSSIVAFQEPAYPLGYLFNMSVMIILGYIFGHALEKLTTLPALVGMVVVGIIFRNVSHQNFLQYPLANAIDYHLRKVYPVIILTKGPLTWELEYIRKNYIKVFSLALIPWVVECVSFAIVARYLLSLPWIWGLHLGSMLSSVSPAVVTPTANKLMKQGYGTKRNVAKLVGNAGGLDTAFSEGMIGVINSAIFYHSNASYRTTKGALSIFVGIGLGIFWGLLADYFPAHNDHDAAVLKVVFIFAGGLAVSYGSSFLGWGGTGGVAIMVCAATASTRWVRRGWALNDNPISRTYTTLWTVFEPMLFTLTGYFLDISQVTLEEFWLVLSCLGAALSLRMLVAFLVTLIGGLSVKESLFISITWIPKAIVEAVVVRLAVDSLSPDTSSSSDQWKIATLHSRVIVIAIVITSTFGSLLTTVLGPMLLTKDIVLPT